MLFNELKIIIKKNNYIEKSKELFWQALQNYHQESPEEFIEKFIDYDEKQVNANINDVSFLAHNWPEGDNCCIVININITYRSKVVGYYDLHFDLEGNIDDDYFVIY